MTKQEIISRVAKLEDAIESWRMVRIESSYGGHFRNCFRFTLETTQNIAIN